MSEINYSQLAGKKVFLTGHTGFKGSWLCLMLKELGAHVTGYALAPPTKPSHFELANIRSLLTKHYEADVLDRTKLTSAIKSAKPDVIMHLAAQSVVHTSYKEPYDTCATNVLGTSALLDAVREAGRPCVVILVTSDKVYENKEHVWGYRETDTLGGHDPYSASKAACDILASSYRRSFFPVDRIADHGVKIAVVRAGNVVGGGDFTPFALVPDLMQAQREGESMQVRAPHAVRPWQHVLDCLSGYLTLANKMLESDDPALCDAWNFGPMPGNEWKVSEMVTRLIEAWEAGQPKASAGWIDTSDPNQLHEAGLLRLCIDKAMWELDWRPKWNVERVIEYTAAWFCAWSCGESVEAVSRAQIQDFLTRDTAKLILRGT